MQKLCIQLLRGQVSFGSGGAARGRGDCAGPEVACDEKRHLCMSSGILPFQTRLFCWRRRDPARHAPNLRTQWVVLTLLFRWVVPLSSERVLVVSPFHLPFLEVSSRGGGQVAVISQTLGGGR